MIPEDPYGEIQMLVSELPDSANTIVAKAQEFRESDEIDFAFELVRLALSKDPAPVIRAEYARLLAHVGRMPEALQEARRCLEEDQSRQHGRRVLRDILVKGLPDTTLSLAETALGQEDSEFSEDLLTAGVEAEPENKVLLEQLARHYAVRGRLVDLIAVLQRLLDIEPEHDEAQLMLAGAFLKQGDLPRAQKLLNRARKRGVASKRLEDLERKVGEYVSVINKSKKS